MNMCASVILGICMSYLETKRSNIQSCDFGQHGQACKEEAIKHGSAAGKATICHGHQKGPEAIWKGAPAMEAMQREFKTSENTKMVVEGWEGMHQFKCRIACNFAGMHLQLRRRNDLGRWLKSTPHKEMLWKQTQQALQKHAERGQRAYTRRNLSQNG